MTARERLYAALDENTCFCSGCEDEAGPSLDVYDARVTAAAYRAAADDLFAWATDGLLNAPEYGSHENVLDAANRLRDRADQMGQQ